MDPVTIRLIGNAPERLSYLTRRYKVNRRCEKMTYCNDQKIARLNRGTYAFLAASFLFFILYSAPHRVHHFFERTEPVSHASADDHHRDSKQPNQVPKNTDCIFQASANRCAFGATAQFQPLTLILLVQDLLIFYDTARPQQFLTAAFHIRAPPKI